MFKSKICMSSLRIVCDTTHAREHENDTLFQSKHISPVIVFVLLLRDARSLIYCLWVLVNVVWHLHVSPSCALRCVVVAKEDDLRQNGNWLLLVSFHT